MLLSGLESLELLGLGKENLGRRKEIFLHITKFSSIFLWTDHQIHHFSKEKHTGCI
jgi:hypothetical protein